MSLWLVICEGLKKSPRNFQETTRRYGDTQPDAIGVPFRASLYVAMSSKIFWGR